MTFKAVLFMLGITEEYGINVFQMMVAIWFFAVGYLLYKKANRAFNQQQSRALAEPAHREFPCLTAESYRTSV